MGAALIDDYCEDGYVDDDDDDGDDGDDGNCGNDDDNDLDGDGDGGSPVVPHGATVALRHVVRLILRPRPGRHHQSGKLFANFVANEYSGFCGHLGLTRHGSCAFRLT